MWFHKPTSNITIPLLKSILKRLIRLETKLHKMAQAQNIDLELHEPPEAVERELLR